MSTVNSPGDPVSFGNRVSCPAAESDGERQLLQRQIDSTDREIDALVYVLHG